jgi:rRNA maturation RNase YbeY
MRNMIIDIVFNFQKKVTLTDRKRLKAFIFKKLRLKKKTPAPLSIVFCSDDYLLQINKLYLKHNYFTDIITFNYSDSPNIINGELFISVDRVKSNAKENSVGQNNELHRVIFHGILHLLGLNDKTLGERVMMRKQEDKWLNEYFNNQ